MSTRALRRCRRVLRGVYADADAEVTARLKAEAAWLYCGGRAVLAGRSAAAVHGVRYLDSRPVPAGDGLLADPEPPVVYRPPSASLRGTDGLVVHRIGLPDDEVRTIGGLRVTSPARTAFDLARWPASVAPGWDACAREDAVRRVALLDALSRRLGVGVQDVEQIAARHPHADGASRARRVLPLVDPGAASPPETRLRLLLLEAGLPPACTQVTVRWEGGTVYAHIDLGWPRWKVGVEYDGAWHRRSARQRHIDINRYHTFFETGWQVVTVDARMLFRSPRAVVARVRDYLRSAGAPV